MIKTYSFSYFTTERVPVLVSRPWWSLFGRDKIEMREQLVRKCYDGISEEEANLLISNQHEPSAALLLILRIVGDIKYVQIEEKSGTAPYEPTEFGCVEKVVKDEK